MLGAAVAKLRYHGDGARAVPEAALKLRESSQSWTESYPSMDYRHGPIAIPAPGRVTWQLGTAPDGPRAPVEATGARFVPHVIVPIAALLCLHCLALTPARARGCGPAPRRHP